MSSANSSEDGTPDSHTSVPELTFHDNADLATQARDAEAAFESLSSIVLAGVTGGDLTSLYLQSTSSRLQELQLRLRTWRVDVQADDGVLADREGTLERKGSDFKSSALHRVLSTAFGRCRTSIEAMKEDLTIVRDISDKIAASK